MAIIGTPWTQQEINQLKELAGTIPAPQVAQKIGRGRDGVLKMIRKLGLPGYSQSAAPKKEPVKEVVEAPKINRHLVSHSPLEWCPNCHAPVSEWDAHLGRMARFGC